MRESIHASRRRDCLGPVASGAHAAPLAWIRKIRHLAVVTALSMPALLGIRAAQAQDVSPAALVAHPATHAAAFQAADAYAGSDRLIVTLRGTARSASADPASRTAVSVAANRAGVGIRHQRAMGVPGTHLMRLSRPLDPAALQRLVEDMRSGDPEIETVEPDRIVHPQWRPNDPMFSRQWHATDAVAGINLPNAWDVNRGKGVVVAVIDTGIRPHADLSGQVLPGYDFISEVFHSNDGDGRDKDPSDPGNWSAAGECGAGSPALDSDWHGTHVAGVVAAVANNGVGVAGVAPEARILPVRVMGRCGGYLSDLAEAITWASGGAVYGVPNNPNPARVLNLSLGTRSGCGTFLQRAIDGARSRGSVVVVAAGNFASDAAGYTPASCAGVISVAAVDRTGGRAWYSNYGASIDVAAPGGGLGTGVLSTINTGTKGPLEDSYGEYSGTSMAAPQVAGVVALMLSRDSSLSPDRVEALLKSSAAERGFPVGCNLCGSGIVDAHRAVLAGTSDPVTPKQYVEVEPNDQLATAQKIDVIPGNVKGQTHRIIDKDHYSMVVPAGKTLKLELIPDRRIDHDLAIFSDSTLRANSSTRGPGVVERLSLTNSGSRDMTVVVRVQPNSIQPRASWAGIGPYELKFSW